LSCFTADVVYEMVHINSVCNLALHGINKGTTIGNTI